MTARFRPTGLSGLAYWYTVLPLHEVVFPLMLRGIRREAESRPPAVAFLFGACGLKGGGFAGQLKFRPAGEVLHVVLQVVRAWQRLAVVAVLASGRGDGGGSPPGAWRKDGGRRGGKKAWRRVGGRGVG